MYCSTSPTLRLEILSMLLSLNLEIPYPPEEIVLGIHAGLGPIIDEISSEYADKAVVGKVDVDANQEFAAKYGVRNIPTVLVFKDGEVVGRQVGVATKASYAESIDALL